MPKQTKEMYKIDQLMSAYEELINLTRLGSMDPDLPMLVFEAYKRMLIENLPENFQNKKEIILSIQESIKFYQYPMIKTEFILKYLNIWLENNNPACFIISPLATAEHSMGLIVRLESEVFVCEIIDRDSLEKQKVTFEKSSSLELSEIMYELSSIRPVTVKDKTSSKSDFLELHSRDKELIYKFFGENPKKSGLIKPHRQYLRIANCFLKMPEISLLHALEKCGITKETCSFMNPEARYYIIKEKIKQIIAEKFPYIKLDEKYKQLDEKYAMYCRNRVFRREIRKDLSVSAPEALLMHAKNALRVAFGVDVNNRQEMLKGLKMVSYTSIFQFVCDTKVKFYDSVQQLFMDVGVDLKPEINPPSTVEIKYFERLAKLLDKSEKVIPQVVRQMREEISFLMNSIGTEMGKQDKSDEAIQYFLKSINIYPQDAKSAYLCMGNLKQSKMDIRGALEDYTKAIELGFGENSHDCFVYLSRAGMRLQTGDFAGTMEDVKDALRLVNGEEKGTAIAYFMWSAVNIVQQNFEEAIKNVTKTITLDPSNGKAYALRAFAKSYVPGSTGVFEDATESIRLGPHDELQRAYEIRVIFRVEIIKNIDKYMDKNIYKYMIGMKEDLKMLKELGGQSKALAQIEPLADLCDTYLCDRQKISSVTESNPEMEAVKYNKDGVAALKEEKYQDAEQYFTKAIAKKPEDAILYNNRGTAREKAKDYRGAITDYDKALELNPKYSKIYGKRGRLKFELKDYKGSLVDCKIAYQIDPYNEVAKGIANTVEDILKKGLINRRELLI